MTKLIDMTGRRFGRLAVLRRGGKRGRMVLWCCLCDCGKNVDVAGEHLRRGVTKSCGCFRQEHSKSMLMKHGLYGTPTYIAWAAMKQRCGAGEDHPSFKFYGARGISVCEKWHQFEGFLSDMGERPDGTSLDRIDNSRGYEPGNCRWASPKEQSMNRRNNILVTLDGEVMPLMAACERLGVPYGRILSRHQRGWDEADLFLPRRGPGAASVRFAAK